MIRRAAVKDIDRIHQIATENMLKDIEHPEEGFLVGEYTKEQYKEQLKQGVEFIVVESEGYIVGFVSAKRERLLGESPFINILKETIKGDYILIDQVCVDRKYKRQGLGRELYNYCIEHLAYDIYLSVVTEPYNEASVEFHKNLGFEEFIDFENKIGKKRKGYRKLRKQV